MGPPHFQHGPSTTQQQQQVRQQDDGAGVGIGDLGATAAEILRTMPHAPRRSGPQSQSTLDSAEVRSASGSGSARGVSSSVMGRSTPVGWLLHDLYHVYDLENLRVSSIQQQLHRLYCCLCWQDLGLVAREDALVDVAQDDAEVHVP